MSRCPHPPREHSHIKENYLYCEVCKVVCNHHTDMKGKDEQKFFRNMKKRTIFCRGDEGHDVEKKDIIFGRDNKPHCLQHPDKTWRWKVVSVRGK